MPVRPRGLTTTSVSTHFVDLLNLKGHPSFFKHLHALIGLEDDLAVKLSHLEVNLGLSIRLSLLDVLNQLLQGFQLFCNLDALGKKSDGIPGVQEVLPELQDGVSDAFNRVIELYKELIHPYHAMKIDLPKEGPGFFLLLLLSKRD